MLLRLRGTERLLHTILISKAKDKLPTPNNIFSVKEWSGRVAALLNYESGIGFLQFHPV